MKTTKFSVCMVIGFCLMGLLVSCQNSVETSPPDSIEAGKGSLRVTLGADAGRTVKPQFEFRHMLIELVPHYATPFGIVSAQFSGVSKTIDVFPGSYRLNAYLYAEASDSLPIAKGSVENVEVATGKSTYCTVTLRLLELTADYTGQGILTWKLPAEYEMSALKNASIRISKNNTLLDTIDLLTPIEQRILDTGYYTLLASFENVYGACSQVYETLWVYKGQTSCWDLSFINGNTFYANPGLININWRLDTERDPSFLSDIQEVDPESIIVFEIEDMGADAIHWYLDGRQVQTGISTLYTLRTAELLPGSHELAVVTYVGNIPRSSSVRFTVRMKTYIDDYRVKNYSELIAVLEHIGSSPKNEAKIIVEASFESSPVVMGPALANKAILITSENACKTISLSDNGSLFTVDTGITLILEKVILYGIDNNEAPLVRLNNSKLVLNEGSVITGNGFTRRISETGGGAGIYMENAALEIQGGWICGNQIQASSENAAQGGGVYAVKGSTILFVQGAIKNNSVDNTYFTDGGSSCGGAIALSNSSLVMLDGIIANNEVHARSESMGTDARGSGIFATNQSSVYLQGGYLINNKVSSYAGNGWHGKSSGTVAIGGIEDNDTKNTFIMSGGIISGNTVHSNVVPSFYSVEPTYSLGSSGGGIYFCGWGNSENTFIKTGGIVYGNDVTETDANGTPLRNTSQIGAAVMFDTGSGDLNPMRNATSYENDAMDSISGWD